MSVYIGNMVKITNRQYEEKYTIKGCPKCKISANGNYCPNCGSETKQIENSNIQYVTFYELELEDDEFYCILDGDTDNDDDLYIGFNQYNDYYKTVAEDDSIPLLAMPKKMTEAQCKKLWKNLIEACEKHNLTYSFEYGILNGSY